MKLLIEEHERVIVHLKEIKSITNEMAEEGLGGEDFAALYVKTKLIPDIMKIFT